MEQLGYRDREERKWKWVGREVLLSSTNSKERNKMKVSIKTKSRASSWLLYFQGTT